MQSRSNQIATSSSMKVFSHRWCIDLKIKQPSSLNVGKSPIPLTFTPLKVVIYADEEGKTFVAYDSFVSLLAQYQREEINQVARLVEQELEALVAEVTTGGGA